VQNNSEVIQLYQTKRAAKEILHLKKKMLKNLYENGVIQTSVSSQGISNYERSD